MMKNILFYTIAVLFSHFPTPKRNRCVHFDIGSHVIICLRVTSSFLQEYTRSVMAGKPLISFR